MTAPILTIDALSVDYFVGGATTRAVDALSLSVAPNEVLGIVGESGSGKSTLMNAVLGALPAGGRIAGGRLLFDGRDLATVSPAEWRLLRWTRLAYVPQGAMHALNPVVSIGSQFDDILRDHDAAGDRAQMRERAGAALRQVALDENVLGRYPHELSGGMRQRVCIAMSILLAPALIIADEPTSALDVVSQRMVIDSLRAIRRQFGTALVFIGHDLALQAEIADRIAIMFAGRLVEIGPAASILRAPMHPYSRHLIQSVPDIDETGPLPAAAEPSEAERARWAAPHALVEVAPGHLVANAGDVDG